jgi:hypothetical protein
MAVLGFIGICGVLRASSSAAPRAVQWLAAALAVAALAVACMAIFTVGRIAYPVGDALDGDPAAVGGIARLRAGIRLTIVALILAVIAALSGWWPTAASNPAAVAVTGTTGQAWCGPLVSGPAEAVSVRTANGIVTVPTQEIAQVSPVGSARRRGAPVSGSCPRLRLPDSDCGLRPTLPNSGRPCSHTYALTWMPLKVAAMADPALPLVSGAVLSPTRRG